MPSSVSFSFYSVTLICCYWCSSWGSFFSTPSVGVRCMCVYVYINGSITIRYRCNQWWVSIKVFAWRLKGGKTQAGGLRCGGMHRYSLIHGHSVRRRGVQTYTLLQNTASPTLTLTFLGLDTWSVRMHFISFDVSGPLRWSP